MQKPFRIEVAPQFAQGGEHYILDTLFLGALSCGCPDARTLARFDAVGVPYRKIEWHDPDDTEQIIEQGKVIEEKNKYIEALRARVVSLEDQIKAQGAKKR